MPAWSLGQIVSHATTALGNRTDISLSDATFWANEAENQVWICQPASEAEAIAISSTTVNEDKITLPSDFQELLTLSNLSDNNALLNPINLDQRIAGSDDSATPTNYIEYSSWFELWPTPDSAYSLELRYRKLRSDMVETTDVPSVSTRYRYAVYLKTRELLADHILDSEAAAIAHNAYVRYMDQVPNDRALRIRENHYTGVGLPRTRGGRSSSYSFDTADD